MIHAIRANDPRFKTVNLGPGLNVLVADTTDESTAKDTRNGVGKSLLMEILHFCLGSGRPQSGGLTRTELTGWAFTADLDIAGERVEVTRSLAMPQSVAVAGNFDGWPVEPTWDKESATHRLPLDAWKRLLGIEMFSHDAAESGGHRYRPSFRSLFPYFGRVRTGAYESPFKFFSGQREYSKQLSIAYLLDLAWPHASEFQELKDQREALRKLQQALEAGALGDAETSLGELRTHRVRLVSQIERLSSQLDSFDVHPEYDTILDEANTLTESIHEHVNASVIRIRKISMYEDQADSEQGPAADEVVALFERAKIELSAETQRTLHEANAFHRKVVNNRRNYLLDEITSLKAEEKETKAEVERLSEKRAELLRFLETKHALREWTQLNERLAELRAELAETDSGITRINEVEERRGALEIHSQELVRSARREYQEREPLWRDAIELFAANTEALYGTPGELIINVGENGFAFDVKIDRSGSHGIDHMMIFAFDLMLAQRWAEKPQSPRTLWHDSELFDGVDERQVGAALQIAASEATSRGFQYFCSLNTDDLPSQEHLGELDIQPVLRLTDESEDGGLFGMRF